jgi:kinesin family protein 2/24
VALREYRNGIEFRPLRETDPVEDHQITVCIRKRPLNKKGKSKQKCLRRRKDFFL